MHNKLFGKTMRKILQLLVWSLIMTASSAASAETDKENLLYLDLDYGRVEIQLMPEIAPAHVERIKTLTRKGFYDGVIWHRVIDGFMAQTGDPTGTGTGGSDLADLKAEFTDTNFARGVVGAARTMSPDTANSQFFICLDDASFLNGQYTVWGKVVEGMKYVDMIEKGEPPANPDKINKATIAADAE
jgi:peptidylprolyl isomerase